ncbi:transporter substrate-binding domain-containing protein [uncultured Aureimonas sp.]|uniref:transporter substrate-binding domain-containing protein n=1 Tax=uncultured Aureimonas sp. TaxID=1604662 RepID=UPI0025DA6CAC|nr:transporter substrate-binding domain-containing protein [uncultured Aureimonas sp.]
MLNAARQDLAPTGRLRAGINLSNSFLVSGADSAGGPVGVSPDMAKAIAARLGVAVEYEPFASPGLLADAAADDVWDIALIGAEPARAEVIDFTAAYAEIEATYMVPAGSPIRTLAEVGRPGIRIAVSARSAYDLWLERNITAATLVRAAGIDASYALFVEEGLDVLAGLRPRLIEDARTLPGARILDGRFSAVQQSIGVRRGRPAGAAFLAAFVEEAKASGLVADLITRRGQEGKLSVADLPPSVTNT